LEGSAIVADASRAEEIERAVSEVELWSGSVDAIVDVVGISAWSPIVETSDDQWQRMVDLNLMHALYVLRYGAPALRRAGGGSVTFVSSISGITSSPGHGAYGAAKAALLSLVRTAAVELRDANIRVNAVAPGPVATVRALETYKGEQPPFRMAAVEDIAAALLFLVSDLARSITGQTLVVDNGVMLNYPIELPVSPW
jgi:NAD(P)-dependent dehydrogenase (short-subunit alcohol dehydrogenase family)